MTTIELICPVCRQSYQRQVNYYNRSLKLGLKMYCGKACSGIARRGRIPKSPEQQKKEKALYDKERRAKLGEKLRAQKRKSYYENYDKEKAAAYRSRKERVEYHREYCRNPEYKEKKQAYDKIHRAKKFYGDFWESSIILNDIESFIRCNYNKREVNYEKGRTNRTQRSKRKLAKSECRIPEIGSLANIKLSQKR